MYKYLIKQNVKLKASLAKVTSTKQVLLLFLSSSSLLTLLSLDFIFLLLLLHQAPIAIGLLAATTTVWTASSTITSRSNLDRFKLTIRQLYLEGVGRVIICFWRNRSIQPSFLLFSKTIIKTPGTTHNYLLLGGTTNCCTKDRRGVDRLSNSLMVKGGDPSVHTNCTA